jgi:subtilisin family serine protease
MASGTSMAAPNTSGVAAMVKGFYPNLTALQLKKVLMDSTTKVAAFKDKTVSGGRVNLKAALSAAAKIKKH